MIRVRLGLGQGWVRIRGGFRVEIGIWSRAGGRGGGKVKARVIGMVMGEGEAYRLGETGYITS